MDAPPALSHMTAILFTAFSSEGKVEVEGGAVKTTNLEDRELCFARTSHPRSQTCRGRCGRAGGWSHTHTHVHGVKMAALRSVVW